jgi:catechol 2,3-dioxygenase-like lactoylglutathione lyase family enzyme
MAISRITDIAYVIYRHRELHRVEQFLLDFGLVRAGEAGSTRLFRGSAGAPFCYILQQAAVDEQPGFVGLGVLVDDQTELAKAAAHRSALGGIEAVMGGAQRVSLHDPSGFRIDLLHGMLAAEQLPHSHPFLINHTCNKPRRAETQRTAHAPAVVYRLGHVALLVEDVATSLEWYRDALGMLLSDALYEDRGGERILTGAFLRCDRGNEWTDHHTVAIFATSREPGIHHASFEVTDLDALAAGGHWLRRRGWKAEWGIGRHVLGSQIFAYWRDPAGFMLEHFTDGDIFQANKEAEYHLASADMLYQWGPEVPQSWLP